MADLASTDVTVTCNLTDMERIGKLRENFIAIAFGDGALTIPTGGGVPLPAISKFGMNSFIKSLRVVEGDGPYKFTYDSANHALVVYHANYGAGSPGVLVNAGGVAIAAQSLKAWVRGK